MHYDKIRAEARWLRLVDYVTRDLGDLVDYRTGELLGERQYITCPHQPDTDALAPPFTYVRSLDALVRYLDFVDRRKLILRNDCRRLFDLDKGNRYLHGTAVKLPTSAYRLLSSLVEQLDYRNTIVASPASLAALVGVRRGNLYRALDSLGALVRVEGEAQGMARGTIKVHVSPAYGFRYLAQDFGLARSEAITDWYGALLH